MTRDNRTLLILLDGADNVSTKRLKKVIPFGSDVSIIRISQSTLNFTEVIDDLNLSSIINIDLSVAMDDIVLSDGKSWLIIYFDFTQKSLAYG